MSEPPITPPHECTMAEDLPQWFHAGDGHDDIRMWPECCVRAMLEERHAYIKDLEEVARTFEARLIQAGPMIDRLEEIARTFQARLFKAEAQQRLLEDVVKAMRERAEAANEIRHHPEARTWSEAADLVENVLNKMKR